MTTHTVQTVPLRHCDFEAKVKVGGSGPPLLYLHSAGGPLWDPLLDRLSQHFTVYAPDHPGTGDTARDSIHAVDTLWDLVLIYDELLDKLGLDRVALLGHSFGGMMGCELAAHRPERIAKMAVIAPIGLWRDDAPVTPYMLLPPDKLVATLFNDFEAEPVKNALKLPTDPKELATVIADNVWALGTTGKFVWPIPDKGLKKRLHRVTAPTLIVWGEKDALISAVYAEEFRRRLADARVEIVKGAGHIPQWEQLDTVTPMLQRFLA